LCLIEQVVHKRALLQLVGLLFKLLGLAIGPSITMLVVGKYQSLPIGVKVVIVHEVPWHLVSSHLQVVRLVRPCPGSRCSMILVTMRSILTSSINHVSYVH
jgi:hypothetical protein